MKNVYDRVALLDDKGEAIITLPDWFEALNRAFRYQLTQIGAFMPLYVADEIPGNRFRIAGGIPDEKVSWQVTGSRLFSDSRCGSAPRTCRRAASRF